LLTVVETNANVGFSTPAAAIAASTAAAASPSAEKP